MNPAILPLDIVELNTMLGGDGPDDLEDWEVVDDEPEVYVSPRVKAADRLFDLHRAMSTKEEG